MVYFIKFDFGVMELVAIEVFCINLIMIIY